MSLYRSQGSSADNERENMNQKKLHREEQYNHWIENLSEADISRLKRQTNDQH